MTIANIERQLTLDFSVPATSPSPNPLADKRIFGSANPISISLQTELIDVGVLSVENRSLPGQGHGSKYPDIKKLLFHNAIISIIIASKLDNN